MRTQAGDRPKEVFSGPTRGWQTYIEQGLRVGEHIIMQNAYIEFHRDISQHFAPPD